MAYAYGFGHGMGMGFGLGFLNFIGTILFIFIVIWVIKMVVRGFRGCAFEGPGGDEDRASGWAGRGWRGPGGHGYRYDYRGGRGRHSRHGSHEGRQRRDEALEVARERLARGQINAEEYERLRKGLDGGPSAGASATSGGEGFPGAASGQRRPRRDQALEIARMRFATGELTSEEFDGVKRALDA